MSAAPAAYTVAVAGLGKRGMHHVEAFAGNPRFRVVGLCNRGPERLEAARVKFPGTHAGADAARMLAETRPDVFAFCTPPQVRLPLIRAGVKAGVKLIAYEKPMAVSTNEAMEIDKLLRDAGIKSVVSHQHRYGEHYRKVKEIIASGEIGRVHTVYGHATGWMMHMMTHLIDYVRWYNGDAEAEWVMGQADGLEKFSDIHSSPDYIAATIQFVNGVRGVVECGSGSPDVPEVEYWWRKCRIGAQGTEGFAEVLTGGGWRAVTRDSNGVLSGRGDMDYAHDMPLYVQDIAAWLDDPAKPHPCNGGSALKGFEIMMAACRSAARRGRVALPLGPGDPELAALKDALQISSSLGT
jgi:predicted dehydrogenase